MPSQMVDQHAALEELAIAAHRIAALIVLLAGMQKHFREVPHGHVANMTLHLEVITYVVIKFL